MQIQVLHHLLPNQVAWPCRVCVRWRGVVWFEWSVDERGGRRCSWSRRRCSRTREHDYHQKKTRGRIRPSLTIALACLRVSESTLRLRPLSSDEGCGGCHRPSSVIVSVVECRMISTSRHFRVLSTSSRQFSCFTFSSRHFSLHP